ncbi:MAG: hypothetical protein R6U26_04280 [Candidatus Undinarchaeales archaeon]
MSDKTENNWNKEKFVKNTLNAFRKQAEERLSSLPPLNNLPFMVPRLRQLYFEMYYVTLIGLNNVSIIMQGVFLEALVKEIIYVNEEEEFKKPFGPAITHCEEQGYLEENNLKFLRKFKNKIRNVYQHIDIEKLSRGIKYPAQIIKFEDPEDVKKKIKKIRKEGMKPDTLIGYEELRPIGLIAKNMIEKKEALTLFKKVDEFARELSEKHFGSDLS